MTKPFTDDDMINEPGMIGLFTRYQAEGAMPNGTRVRKIVFEPGDAHPVGSLATILGSTPKVEGMPFIFYFVEWDNLPRHAVGIQAHKIADIFPYRASEE